MIAINSNYLDATDGLITVRTWGESEAQARSRAYTWIVEHRVPFSIFKIGVDEPVCTTTSRMYASA